jgi:hypothetical protein
MNTELNTVVNKIGQALKAIYDFFAGDVSILTGASVAFVGAFVLLRYVHASNALVAALFIAFLLAGLFDSLNREVGSQETPGHHEPQDGAHQS